MAKLNAPTWLQKFTDFIDRVAPFDTDPLIQKAEHQIVTGDDLSDSVVFRLPVVQAINAPAAAFNVDFATGDRFDVDTTGSADGAFTITLSGLDGNNKGLLKITKKSGDTFTFANGLIAVVGDTRGQSGKTEIYFRVELFDTDYVVDPLYDYHTNILDGVAAGGELTGTYPNPSIADNVIDSANIIDGTIANGDLAGGIGQDKLAGSIPHSKLTSETAKHNPPSGDLNDIITGGIYTMYPGLSNLPPTGSATFQYGNLTVTQRQLTVPILGTIDLVVQTINYYQEFSGSFTQNSAVRISTNNGAGWNPWF
jgi:hypothetical protein